VINSEYSSCTSNDLPIYECDDAIYTRRPLEEIVANMEKNKFVFDPENGGGRRRRVKNVSRIEMIKDNKKQKPISYEPEPALLTRPFNIHPDLYK
jgi:hypothetical protein